MIYRFVMLVALAFTLTPQANGQDIDPYLAVQLGATETPSGPGKTIYAAYPEVEASVGIYRFDRIHVEMRGSVRVGAWSDRFAQNKPACVDCAAYSNSAYSTGARIHLVLENAIVPIGFFGGLSHHIVVGDLLYDIDWSPTEAEDYSYSYQATEVGGRISISVFRALSLVGQFQAQIPFTDQARAATLRTVTVGVDMAL